jgi:ADP-dependent NAD(P)H-hydrate dehydratase
MNRPQPHPAIELDEQALRAWPLPQPPLDGDKEERGRVLIVGGSREMPGAVILAAGAALRAGAGKLVIATGNSVARLVALAVPESRVIELPENPDGSIAAAAASVLQTAGETSQAVLIGPGMQDEAGTCELVHGLLPKLGDARIVLDACAMGIVCHAYAGEQEFEGSAILNGGLAKRYAGRVLLTPHAGEMAHLCGADKDLISQDASRMAQGAARHWKAVVALKGAVTWIASPQGQLWRHAGGNVGLAVSGSGDVLAGIIAGLAARGAPLEQAAAWGVALHAKAGERLARRIGPIGYLAREIADEVPLLMHDLQP